MKKIFVSFLLLFFMIVTGCEEEQQLDEKKEEIRGNCVVTECIKKIETTNSVEEINNIIGFEAEKSEYSESYTWKLSDKTWITRDASGTAPILQATIDKETIQSDAVDFSVYSDIKKMLDSGTSLSYEEMVSKLGGVEGTLAGKTSTSNRYIWVDKSNRTFSATFSNTLGGKCSIISLR